MILTQCKDTNDIENTQIYFHEIYENTQIYIEKSFENTQIWMFDFIYTGIEIISDLSNLLPAFAIMNKKLRKIGIFIMSLIVIWWIIQDIMWVIE